MSEPQPVPTRHTSTKKEAAGGPQHPLEGVVTMRVAAAPPERRLPQEEETRSRFGSFGVMKIQEVKELLRRKSRERTRLEHDGEGVTYGRFAKRLLEKDMPVGIRWPDQARLRTHCSKVREMSKDFRQESEKTVVREENGVQHTLAKDLVRTLIIMMKPPMTRKERETIGLVSEWPHTMKPEHAKAMQDIIVKKMASVEGEDRRIHDYNETREPPIDIWGPLNLIRQIYTTKIITSVPSSFLEDGGSSALMLDQRLGLALDIAEETAAVTGAFGRELAIIKQVAELSGQGQNQLIQQILDEFSQAQFQYYREIAELEDGEFNSRLLEFVRENAVEKMPQIRAIAEASDEKFQKLCSQMEEAVVQQMQTLRQVARTKPEQLDGFVQNFAINEAIAESPVAQKVLACRQIALEQNSQVLGEAIQELVAGDTQEKKEHIHKLVALPADEFKEEVAQLEQELDLLERQTAGTFAHAAELSQELDAQTRGGPLEDIVTVIDLFGERPKKEDLTKGTIHVPSGIFGPASTMNLLGSDLIPSYKKRAVLGQERVRTEWQQKLASLPEGVITQEKIDALGIDFTGPEVDSIITTVASILANNIGLAERVARQQLEAENYSPISMRLGMLSLREALILHLHSGSLNQTQRECTEAVLADLNGRIAQYAEIYPDLSALIEQFGQEGGLSDNGIQGIPFDPDGYHSLFDPLFHPELFVDVKTMPEVVDDVTPASSIATARTILPGSIKMRFDGVLEIAQAALRVLEPQGLRTIGGLLPEMWNDEANAEQYLRGWRKIKQEDLPHWIEQIASLICMDDSTDGAGDSGKSYMSSLLQGVFADAQGELTIEEFLGGVVQFMNEHGFLREFGSANEALTNFMLASSIRKLATIQPQARAGSYSSVLKLLPGPKYNALFWAVEVAKKEGPAKGALSAEDYYLDPKRNLEFHIEGFYQEVVPVLGEGEQWRRIAAFFAPWVEAACDYSIRKENKLKHNRAIIVIGPTGIGKTYMVRKFYDAAERIFHRDHFDKKFPIRLITKLASAVTVEGIKGTSIPEIVGNALVDALLASPDYEDAETAINDVNTGAIQVWFCLDEIMNKVFHMAQGDTSIDMQTGVIAELLGVIDQWADAGLTFDRMDPQTQTLRSRHISPQHMVFVLTGSLWALRALQEEDERAASVTVAQMQSRGGRRRKVKRKFEVDWKKITAKLKERGIHVPDLHARCDVEELPDVEPEEIMQGYGRKQGVRENLMETLQEVSLTFGFPIQGVREEEVLEEMERYVEANREFRHRALTQAGSNLYKLIRWKNWEDLIRAGLVDEEGFLCLPGELVRLGMDQEWGKVEKWFKVRLAENGAEEAE